MIYKSSVYINLLKRLIQIRSNFIKRNNLTPYEQEEFKFHKIQMQDLCRFHYSARGKFITTIKEAEKYIIKSLLELDSLSNIKSELLKKRKEINNKLALSPLSEYKNILQCGWYHVFSQLDPEIHEYNCRFIKKLRSYYNSEGMVKKIEILDNQELFDFLFTPYHPEFKSILGGYVIKNYNNELDPEDYLFLYDRNVTNFGKCQLKIITVQNKDY